MGGLEIWASSRVVAFRFPHTEHTTVRCRRLYTNLPGAALDTRTTASAKKEARLSHLTPGVLSMMKNAKMLWRTKKKRAPT